MLVATSLSPRSSLEELALAGWIKVYHTHNSTLEIVLEKVALWNNQSYDRLGWSGPPGMYHLHEALLKPIGMGQEFLNS